ncbi:MAG: hypothetical protein ACOY3K_00565 [Candidatus Omnitrophota bacterium]
MKKTLQVVVLLVVAVVMLSGVSYAATVEGAVVSVDAEAMALEVATVDGSVQVNYVDTTVWPEGVTDPTTLVGQNVVVEQDDVTLEAVSVSVEEVVAAEAAPAAEEVAPVAEEAAAVAPEVAM